MMMMMMTMTMMMMMTTTTMMMMMMTMTMTMTMMMMMMMMMRMNLQALFCSLRLIESFMIFSAEALGNLSTNRQNAEKCLLLTVGHAEIYP